MAPLKALMLAGETIMFCQFLIFMADIFMVDNGHTTRTQVLKVWSGLLDQHKVDQLTGQNVMFDILEPPAFRK